MPTKPTMNTLLGMKQRIETAKIDEAKVKGRVEKLKEQLMQDFECDSVEESKPLAADIEKRIIEKDKQLIFGTESLLQKYDWE